MKDWKERNEFPLHIGLVRRGFLDLIIALRLDYSIKEKAVESMSWTPERERLLEETGDSEA